MKVFLAGSVSSATKNQLGKYDVYKKVILSAISNTNIVTPDDIYAYRNDCIKLNPDFSKAQIDKLMVDFDLRQVRESDLVVCDISEQSSGMGLELGVCKENDVPLIFCFEKDSYVSNMIYGAFSEAPFIEYVSLADLEEKLTSTLKDFK